MATGRSGPRTVSDRSRGRRRDREFDSPERFAFGSDGTQSIRTRSASEGSWAKILRSRFGLVRTGRSRKTALHQSGKSSLDPGAGRIPQRGPAAIHAQADKSSCRSGPESTALLGARYSRVSGLTNVADRSIWVNRDQLDLLLTDLPHPRRCEAEGRAAHHRHQVVDFRARGGRGIDHERIVLDRHDRMTQAAGAADDRLGLRPLQLRDERRPGSCGKTTMPVSEAVRKAFRGPRVERQRVRPSASCPRNILGLPVRVLHCWR